MKMMTLFAIFLLLIGFVFADGITGYAVPSIIPLGDSVTATGIFEDFNGNKQGFLCSFYFFDANTGDLVKRATDQYTTSTGRVTLAGFQIMEPLFKRERSYTLKTECGLASADANFLVAQIESFSAPAEQNFSFLTDKENTSTFFIWLLIFLFVAFIFGSLYFIYKKAKRF